MPRHQMQTRRGNARRAPSVAPVSAQARPRRAAANANRHGREGQGDATTPALTLNLTPEVSDDQVNQLSPPVASAIVVGSPPAASATATAARGISLSPVRPPSRARSIASSASAMQREALLEAISSIQAQLAPLASLPQRVESLQEDLARVRSSQAVVPSTSLPTALQPVTAASSAPQLRSSVVLPTVTAAASEPALSRPAPLRVTVPTFDGTLGRWEPFLRQFSTVRNLLQWDYTTTGQMLLAHLRDAALDAVMALPEPKDDLNRLESFLSTRFGASAAIDVCQAQLEGRIRKSGEDLYAFARDVEILARRTYPGSPEELIQREALAVFLNGVSAEAHKRIKYERARTMSDALAIAIQCESYTALKAAQRSVRAVQVVAQSKPQSSSDARQTLRARPCPNCGKTGHLLSECKAPQVCFICKKDDHRIRDCPQNKNPKSDEKSHSKQSKSGNGR